MVRKTDLSIQVASISLSRAPPSASLDQEASFREDVESGAVFPSVARVISQLCLDSALGPERPAAGPGCHYEEVSKVVPAIVTAFLGGGIAPVVVGRLQHSAG